jgi:hypothetical protein
MTAWRRVNGFVLAMLVALAQPVSAQAEPAAEASPPALPEIGRTRANSAACAAMRDLVLPSFAAAGRADAQFAETRKRLPRYIQLAADPIDKKSVVREGALSKLGSDASRLMQEALVIKQALADPRLPVHSGDPQIAAERAQLEQLFAVQAARARLLNEFVMRESTSMAVKLVGMEDSGAFGSPLTLEDFKVEHLPGKPLPAVTGAPGMPVLSGAFVALDKRQVDEWGAGISQAVRAKENEAAKAFLPIAASCR